MNDVTNNSYKSSNNSFDFELGIQGFNFSDLFDAEKLRELTEKFYEFLDSDEPVVAEALKKYTEARGKGFEPKIASKILTDSAPYLSEFVAKIFKIEGQRSKLQKRIQKDDPLWKYKFFVQRRAVRKYKTDAIQELNLKEIRSALRELRNTAFDDSLLYDEE